MYFNSLVPDHTEHHEPESTSEPSNRQDVDDDEEEVEPDEKETKEEIPKSENPTSDEPKQRERIKIVWDKEETAGGRPYRSRKEPEVALNSKKSDREAGRDKSRDRDRMREKEKERDKRSRSRSRSRNRYEFLKTVFSTIMIDRSN